MEQWVRIWFDENRDIVRCEPVPPRDIYREPDPIGWNNGPHQRGPICTHHFPVHHCDCRTCNLTINQRIALHEMKTYRCHKIVQACKIVHVTASMHSDDLRSLPVVEFETQIVVKALSQFKNTVAGDYYVVYDDGYASRSPAAAFEAGYTEVKAVVDVDTARLQSTDDASVWAEEFAKVLPHIDRGVMIGWFANCAEMAKDGLRRRDRENGLGDTFVPTERSLQLAAQGWCGPDTSHIQMDSRLAYEFAKILDRELLKKTA